MKFLAPLFAAALLVSIPAMTHAQTNTQFSKSEPLQKIVDNAVHHALEKFADRKLKTNEIAVTLVDLRDSAKITSASCRGGEQIYPASVIKLFYLVAAHRWMEDGKLKDTEELRRAMRDMIVESYNEATGLIVDSLTGVTSGPELSPEELEKWYEKRNVVNRYFSSLGFTNINVNRKPWCEGPYGREMQSVKAHAPNHRNWLTTEATARILTEIVTHKAVTSKRCDEMMELLSRDPFNTTSTANGQARGYTGTALPKGSKLWSKAGWTSESRHDAAYVELPTGEKFVLVVFTSNHAKENEILTAIAKSIVEQMSPAK